MAFVVEDGTGLANANSYVSAANARQYWLDQGVVFSQADSAAPGTVSLETALVAACRYMELRFRAMWKGYIQFPPTTNPVFAGQALSWPRLCVKDVNGYTVSGVPTAIKNAQAEYMKRALSSTGLLPDPSQNPNLVRKKVGPLESEFLPNAVQLIKPYPTADALFTEFLRTGNYSTR